jgi:hypothetical protein
MMAQTIQCGGVCATRLGSDLTAYTVRGTGSRWSARRRGHCRSATATASPACSACPVWRHALSDAPPCVIRIFCLEYFCFLGRTACGLCRSYVRLGARRDGDAHARARATRTRRRREYTQHTGRRAHVHDCSSTLARQAIPGRGCRERRRSRPSRRGRHARASPAMRRLPRDALTPDVELGQGVRAQTIQCGGVCATRLKEGGDSRAAPSDEPLCITRNSGNAG